MPKSLDVIQNFVYYQMDDILNIHKEAARIGFDETDVYPLLEIYVQEPGDFHRNASKYLWCEHGRSWNGLSEDDIEDIATFFKDKFDEAAAILDLRLDWRDWS
jgi:hypothetical protein